ncbi:MAG: amino acid adenylation domain-containing protein [Planctomycetota bacterium]
MDRPLLNSSQKPTRLPPEYQERLEWMPAHRIFEETVAEAPDVIAISSGGREYTYREANEVAERVARFIVARGLPPETPVGVYADRSPELFIAFAGILKAGCCYVPLDPLHPVERLKYMLDELKTGLILSAEPSHPFGEIAGIDVVPIRSIIDAPAVPCEGHPRTVKPNHLAYIIFTSGSTGRPKGVMLEHKGLVNFCYYFKHFHKYKIGERCAELVRPGFDASISELAGFFFNGVGVYIPDNDAMANPARLVDFIVKHKVTRSFAATPLCELLIEEEWPQTGVAFYEIQSGGETLRKRPTPRHPFHVTNVYGPTENTNISTEYIFIENAGDDPRPPPIGYALANTEAIILTEDLKPVQPGQEGELFLGGVQLARGYLNRPDLTAEKFIPHPFDPTPGARLYRSGDLARYRDDGAIEHISRIDFQVKIRGHRIELGEIETVLNAQTGVKQAVVVPVMKDGKAESLAAFWVADLTRKTDSTVLADAMKKLLPSAMLPSYFKQLDVLPLSPNGKIDRKALPLPLPKSESPSQMLACVAPSDELEAKLVEIWKNVLRFPMVSVRDNFINIGGTSLTALRLVSQIRRELKHDIPVGRIFATATIEKLAEEIRSPKSVEVSKGCLIQIQPGLPGYAPIFGIHGFGGHIFQFYLLAKYLGFERPVYALRASGLETGETADDTYEKMAARYVKEILPIVKGGPVHLCGYSLGGAVAVEVARQLQAAKHAVGIVGILDMFAKGYPQRLPFKDRLKIHLHTLFAAPFSEKKKYIAKRLNNVSERLYFMVGKPYIHPEERRGTEEIIPDAVFWAHRTAMATYAFARYDGPVDLFRADTPPDWPGNRFDDPKLGWEPFAQSITVHSIPGTHWTMIQSPNIRLIADVYTTKLRQ